MFLGVDLDNTLACYDGLFHQLAVEEGLVPPSVGKTKGEVRDWLRAAGREPAWTALQGRAYGRDMRRATMFPGALEALSEFRRRGVRVAIVSHRTPQPITGEPYDLHRAARDWLERQGVHEAGQASLARSAVCLEATKQGKMDRIRQLGCTHFIDDLPEVLLDAGFPPGVHRILFDPGRAWKGEGLDVVRSWHEVAERVRKGAEVWSHGPYP